MEGVTVSSENYSDNKQVNQDWKKGVMFYLHDLIYMLITILLVFLLFFKYCNFFAS